MKNYIYLDHAATTPIDLLVVEAMKPYLEDGFGNASSIHTFGQKALSAIDKSRSITARFLGCNPSEIIFTGSATESDNLAIRGVVDEIKKNNPEFTPHVIVSTIEHSAVLECCRELECMGVETSCVSVNKNGIVSTDELKKNIRDNTVLISIMYVNNEIGTIQPIESVSKIIKEVRVQNKSIYPLFHCDAVQAVNYLDCNVKRLGVDLMTVSSHKIYGPKGLGVLYLKNGVKIRPLIFGGVQENRIRPGTENIAGIVGFGKAIELIEHRKAGNINIKKMRDRLIDKLINTIPHCRLNGSKEERINNNINISIDGVNGKKLVLLLDQRGIAVSTGSACHSNSNVPSHVLKAIGLSDKSTLESIRISLGRTTTFKDLDYAADSIIDGVKCLRENLS